MDRMWLEAAVMVLERCSILSVNVSDILVI